MIKIKTEIREQVGNKLQLAKTLLELVKEGKAIKPGMAIKAIKDIDGIMELLDRNKNKV